MKTKMHRVMRSIVNTMGDMIRGRGTKSRITNKPEGAFVFGEKRTMRTKTRRNRSGWMPRGTTTDCHPCKVCGRYFRDRGYSKAGVKWYA